MHCGVNCNAVVMVETNKGLRNRELLLSVIVPVHNVERYLSDCVESLVAQSMAEQIEVIIVENGSTDSSEALCRRLAATYPMVRVVVSDMVGLSAARNFGVSHARGKLVGFVDSDDYVEPEMFSCLVDAKLSTGADIAYCNYMLEYDDGRCERPFPDTGNVVVRSVADVVGDIIAERSTSSSCVRIYNRDFFNSRQFPVGEYYEDHSTVYRWMSEMQRIVHVDSALYHYRMRSGSITSTTNSNTKKILDFFNADYGRMEFAGSYAGFSRRQRNDAMRHIVRNLMRHMRDYIVAGATDGENDKLLAYMRMQCRQALALPMPVVGFGAWRRLRHMAYFWHSYYSHYARR